MGNVQTQYLNLESCIMCEKFEQTNSTNISCESLSEQKQFESIQYFMTSEDVPDSSSSSSEKLFVNKSNRNQKDNEFLSQEQSINEIWCEEAESEHCLNDDHSDRQNNSLIDETEWMKSEELKQIESRCWSGKMTAECWF